MKYTVQAATEWSIGGGVNGTGRRHKIHGFYVVNPQGRRVRAFDGAKAEQQATAWASHCDAHTDESGNWR